MSKQIDVEMKSGYPAHVRMGAEERRQQIVRVAMSLFAQRGFRGTTTKEIAQAAGVSEAIIFRHFATKEELYSAIINQKACAGAVSGTRAAAAEAMRLKDDRGVFLALAHGMLELHDRDPGFMRLLLYAALEGHELAQMFWERIVREHYEFIGDYIRERQRDGEFRDCEPLVAVRAFLGAVIHHSLSNNLWDKQRTLIDVTNEEAARQFTDILLQGITVPSRIRTRAGRSSNSPRRKKK
jgi:AcrR family transcriptional regulator